MDERKRIVNDLRLALMYVDSARVEMSEVIRDMCDEFDKHEESKVATLDITIANQTYKHLEAIYETLIAMFTELQARE